MICFILIPENYISFSGTYLEIGYFKKCTVFTISIKTTNYNIIEHVLQRKEHEYS